MMRWLSRLLRPITHPVIASNHDLRRYVIRVTITAAVLALLLDVGNQLAFFVDWATALRSWTLTIIDSTVIALLISILIARSQRDLHQAKRRVEELSRTDELTGLPNRRAIMEAVAGRGMPVMMLVIVDIDRFKSINDGHGHRVGDVVIREVGQRLAAVLADAALVGRLGGEEFAILAAEEAAAPLLQALARVQDELAADPIRVADLAIPVTISAGAAMREPGETFERLYTEADSALYVAKRAGRDRIALSPRLERFCEDRGEERPVAA